MILNLFGDIVEYVIRCGLIIFTFLLPVKEIRNEKGVPFLYRYHLFSWSGNGPSIVIHRFVMSDPDRGYHDHPWKKAISFILCGEYEERIYDETKTEKYYAIVRKRWTFNYLDGVATFHRVMVKENCDVWTLFVHQKRSKTWNMRCFNGDLKQMSTQVEDNDPGWWNHVKKGMALVFHLPHPGKVVLTVDIIVLVQTKILLIKRGKDPCKGQFAFPGGRVEQKDINVEYAAKRELKEETNIENVDLQLVKTVGNNYRDERGFYATWVYLARLESIPKGVKAGDDAVDYQWFNLKELPEKLAFDHREILDSICLD